ncbi:MAG TPA: hypothetical protein VND68_03990 [Chloroflexia bacterium]|nr:hypothetical protein [Chloroflexia bacterium]
MDPSRLPTEVELVYDVMPCNAMRTEMEPGQTPHPCTYFRKWGTYHSYDYTTDGPPPERGIVHETRYLGRARLVPELLSGCRKAPIMAVGINPNLPGWWPLNRDALNPLFDDYKQYAHYFRYRTVDKLDLSKEDYEKFGGGPQDTPFSTFELNVPANEQGDRVVQAKVQHQKMYLGYQMLLEGLAEKMGWQDHKLSIGEDLSYGNMVACPSARWTTRPIPKEPDVPLMTNAERKGIVTECFHKRKHFVRQLFQSLPAILLVFSQNTADAIIGEFKGRFTSGNPRVGDKLDDLMNKVVRLRYGELADGTMLEARVIFSPHISGNPEDFERASAHVIGQLVDEAKAGGLRFNKATKHLSRTVGACVFCTMLQIGPCDYVDELQPISPSFTALTADSPVASLLEEKATQRSLMNEMLGKTTLAEDAWARTDDTRESDPAVDALV